VGGTRGDARLASGQNKGLGPSSKILPSIRRARGVGKKAKKCFRISVGLESDYAEERLLEVRSCWLWALKSDRPGRLPPVQHCCRQRHSPATPVSAVCCLRLLNFPKNVSLIISGPYTCITRQIIAPCAVNPFTRKLQIEIAIAI
jgi:hypothetical protein